MESNQAFNQRRRLGDNEAWTLLSLQPFLLVFSSLVFVYPIQGSSWCFIIITIFWTDGILLGGILIMYELHNYMRPILLLMYSFWIPQIVTNVIRDSRKPLHPYYIVGMTATRLAIPLYVFGCPHNFMRIVPSKAWCVFLCTFMGLQAVILLLQHYFGSRCFVPRQVCSFTRWLHSHRWLPLISFIHRIHRYAQMLPEKYNYHRRFNQDVSRNTDCVICMTAINLRQRTSDFMVELVLHSTYFFPQ